MVKFLRAPRAAFSLGGLQSEPDLRHAHESSSRANLLVDMRKGEPKVVLRTDRSAFKRGERQRPGAATRYKYARRHIAEMATHSNAAFLRSRFHVRSKSPVHSRQAEVLDRLRRTILEIQCRVTGQETHGYTL
jgi:hypothetical protein